MLIITRNKKEPHRYRSHNGLRNMQIRCKYSILWSDCWLESCKLMPYTAFKLVRYVKKEFVPKLTLINIANIFQS